MTSGSSTPRWRARARTRIQPEANEVTGSGKRRDHSSLSADGGQSAMAPASSALLGAAHAAQVAERDAATFVVARDALDRAVQIDRLVVAGLADERDHALRLAERIDADEVRALGKQRDRMQELGDLPVRRAVPEHRQAERRFGDEDVAADELERRAGRIGDVLVVAGGDDAQPVGLDGDLRRAEHMAGGMEGDARAVEPYGLAIGDRLRRAGEILAVAQPHQIERLLRRQHRAVTGARVVGMTVRDEGLVDRSRRIDMEAAELAAHAGRRRHEDVFGTHGPEICCK